MLAGIMTAFGAPTGAVPIGGNGEFDGVMLASFTKPRIEGTFTGDRMRAWDVVWGHGTADVVIENSYADVANAVMTAGRIGDPRRRHSSRSAIRARTAARRSTRASGSTGGRWPTCGTPSSSTTTVDGLVSGDYHVYGPYETPFGFGNLPIEQGVAYGETLRARDVVAALRGDRRAARLARDPRRAPAAVTGAAFVGWDGDYSFNADGSADPGRVAADGRRFRSAPLSGPAAVHRDRRRHVRRAALRRASCASTTCSPATKASAS